MRGGAIYSILLGLTDTSDYEGHFLSGVLLLARVFAMRQAHPVVTFLSPSLYVRVLMV